MDIEPKVGSLREELSHTARMELSRKRRRLGNLTPEQESAVETLLITTTNKISDFLIQRMQRSSEASEKALGDI
jgi:glutamyl-tRNA reductase